MEMIFFSAAVLVFLGGSADSEFLKMANCDRDHVYCYRENLFALCFDAEELHVFWKFNVQCFIGANCQHDNFPCTSPTASQAFLPIVHAYDLGDACTTTGNINTTSTETTENSNSTSTETAGNENGTTTETAGNENGTTTETTESTNGTTTTQTNENVNDTTTETDTTTIESTTLEPTTTIGPPSCTNTDSYKGPNCQQYYQCVSVWWWYEPTLVTCSSGQSYNATAKVCTADPTCNPQA